LTIEPNEPTKRGHRVVDSGRRAVEEALPFERHIAELGTRAVDAKRLVDRVEDRNTECCGAAEPGPWRQVHARLDAKRRTVSIRGKGLAECPRQAILAARVGTDRSVPGRNVEQISIRRSCDSEDASR
jgi:hypothetical protein